MPKKTSAWAQLAAVLVALQVYGCAVAAHAGEWDRLAAIPVGSVADEIKVRTALTSDGKAVQVVVALILQVDFDVVWAVLNDYENMPRFVPDILEARVISAGSGRKRVEIEGVARLLFLEIPTHTTLDVVYRPDGSVAIDSVAGNLATHGVIRLHGDGPYTRVDYEVLLTPDFWLPPVIGDFLIGRQITRQFEGLVAEMHRRAHGHQTLGLMDYGLGTSSPAQDGPGSGLLRAAASMAWREDGVSRLMRPRVPVR